MITQVRLRPLACGTLNFLNTSLFPAALSLSSWLLQAEKGSPGQTTWESCVNCILLFFSRVMSLKLLASHNSQLLRQLGPLAEPQKSTPSRVIRSRGKSHPPVPVTEQSLLPPFNIRGSLLHLTMRQYRVIFLFYGLPTQGT